jgi:anti-sigma factor ChrR (cupin superfamily)
MDGDTSLDEQDLDLLDEHLPASVAASPPSGLRQELLDLAEAPRLPLELEALEWRDLFPGVKYAPWREDPARNMRGWIIWAKPGARSPRHRHLGAENVLVLQGALKDDRGIYGAGRICRSREGSVHSEEAMDAGDCLCYAVYYGALEPVE